MRKTLLAGVMGLVIGAGAGGAVIAYSQPAVPPGGPGPVSGLEAPGPHPGPAWMRWMHRGPGAWRAELPFNPGTFALFFRPADRQLTPDDVQKIAEAFLLWNGNHTWKVIDVAPGSDNQVGFAYAAPDNTVIARFSMDMHTGRVTRTG